MSLFYAVLIFLVLFLLLPVFIYILIALFSSRQKRAAPALPASTSPQLEHEPAALADTTPPPAPLTHSAESSARPLYSQQVLGMLAARFACHTPEGSPHLLRGQLEGRALTLTALRPGTLTLSCALEGAPQGRFMLELYPGATGSAGDVRDARQVMLAQHREAFIPRLSAPFTLVRLSSEHGKLEAALIIESAPALAQALEQWLGECMALLEASASEVTRLLQERLFEGDCADPEAILEALEQELTASSYEMIFERVRREGSSRLQLVMLLRHPERFSAQSTRAMLLEQASTDPTGALGQRALARLVEQFGDTPELPELMLANIPHAPCEALAGLLNTLARLAPAQLGEGLIAAARQLKAAEVTVLAGALEFGYARQPEALATLTQEPACGKVAIALAHALGTPPKLYARALAHALERTDLAGARAWVDWMEQEHALRAARDVFVGGLSHLACAHASASVQKLALRTLCRPEYASHPEVLAAFMHVLAHERAPRELQTYATSSVLTDFTHHPRLPQALHHIIDHQPHRAQDALLAMPRERSEQLCFLLSHERSPLWLKGECVEALRELGDEESLLAVAEHVFASASDPREILLALEGLEGVERAQVLGVLHILSARSMHTCSPQVRARHERMHARLLARFAHVQGGISLGEHASGGLSLAREQRPGGLELTGEQEEH